MGENRKENNFYNNSHCADPTAAAAMANMGGERRNAEVDRRARELIGVLVRIVSLSGFCLDSRLELTHVRTGRKYGGKRRVRAETETSAKSMADLVREAAESIGGLV